MKNVLLFTHKLSGGGAEKTVRRLAAYINEHDCGYHAVVCVIHDDIDYHDEVDELIVLPSKSSASDNKLKRGLNVFRQIRELREIKLLTRPDVCISFLPGADRINILSHTGEQLVVSVRVKESYFTHDILRKTEICRSYSKADRVITVSDYVRQDVLDFFGADPSKVTTIHNSIEPSNEDADTDILPEVADFVRDHRVLINVGRLDEQKGQDHLIRAFARVHGSHPDTVLLILGEGEWRSHLETIIHENACDDCIMLAGNVHDTHAYLKRADVFVLSSNVEGMPNVILEAMSAGLPCISTECGSREILAPGTDVTYAAADVDYAEYGVLIPIRDEDIMERAICRMLDDDELRQRYIGLAHECLEGYTPDRIYGEWIRMLDELSK